jgi:hypothetical protein
MEAARNKQIWRDNAIGWIKEHAVTLPETPKTRWHVARPKSEALDSALFIIGNAPLSSVPVELAVTLDRGIELDWRNGPKELEIEVLSDGSLEILQSVNGNAINERKLPKPDLSLLAEAFVWLEHG